METECSTVLLLLLWIECVTSYNVATSGSKQFVGSKEHQFGYQVQQLSDQRILIGSPWSDYPGNRKGDVFRCDITSTGSTCDNLHLPESIVFPEVKNVDVNMSLGLTLTRTSDGHFMACAPLWAQQCGSQYYLPGACAKDNAPLAIVPALQTCGGPVDIVIVLDGSNSIYPWAPVTTFLHRLIETMNIGPANTQVSIIQYGVDPKVEFYLNSHLSRESLLVAAASITQKYGLQTNTFSAIEFARQEAFLPDHGGRPGATKVMVVVTDGESHDESLRNDVIKQCQEDSITRFGIAVLGYYNRNDQDTSKLIAEIKSIASVPSEQYFFNVSDENALVEIAGTLGDRIFNIEGTGQGLQFKMEMSQVGFSAHQTRDKDTWLFGAVGAYDWSGTVVHQTADKTNIFPENSFAEILQDRNDSAYLGYSVTTLYDGMEEYFVAGAPRSNHTGQVVVYTLTSRGQPDVLDSHRGEQLGSYYGGVLCSLDVDGDGTSDLLLVSAPNFMSPLKKQTGRVYLLSFSKGVLTDRGVLSGPSPAENSGFGQALAGAGDLDLDGYTDVVVGAPLEEDNKGVIYIYNGDKSTLRTQYSQKIRGSTLDSGLRYFGRSLDTTFDLNGDLVDDVTVGAYGTVFNLWSRPVAVVTATVTFDPPKLSLSDRPVSKATVCLTAIFRPSTASGPLVLWCNTTVDSRGTLDGEDGQQQEVQVHLENGTPVCHTHTVYAQEHPESLLPLSLQVTVSQSDAESSPVLDHYSTSSWSFEVPFAKDCGSDDVCKCDLSIQVKPKGVSSSSKTLLISYNDRRLSFEVSVANAAGVDRAYNVRLTTKYSNNVYYSSVTQPHDATVVECDVTDMLTCVVGYPALMDDQEVTFTLNFDLGVDEQPLQGDASFTFNVLSDDTELQPRDNQVTVSLPLTYDSELSLSRESNLNFYVSDGDAESGDITSLDDIGPEYNFTIEVSTGNFPVHVCFLSIEMPSSMEEGNPLLFLTEVATQPSDDVTCDVTVDTMPSSASFSKERLFGTKQLDCDTATCRPIKCVLKNMSPNRKYSISVNTRIWSGTFATALFESIELISTAHIETQQLDLLIVTHPQITVDLSITKPGAESEVPVGVIVGSAIGGLLLLAMVVLALWKLGFFKRKYKELEQKERAEEGETDALQSNKVEQKERAEEGETDALQSNKE